MQEIEAKFYVMDLNGVRMRLQSLEARLIQERVLETNIRFDLPGGGLRSEGRVIRLRRDTEAKFTYKGPSTVEQGILNHIEIEFTVGDFDKAKAFIEAIGYQPFFYYEKYRTTYDVQTSEVSTHVMLDELPYGNFVEIEGESPESIRAVANKLNLNWDTAIPTSYHLLFERLCTKYPSIDPTNLSFTALETKTITAADLSVQAADG